MMDSCGLVKPRSCREQLVGEPRLCVSSLLSQEDPFSSPTCRPTPRVCPSGPRASTAGQSCLVLLMLPPELPQAVLAPGGGGCLPPACNIPAPTSAFAVKAGGPSLVCGIRGPVLSGLIVVWVRRAHPAQAGGQERQELERENKAPSTQPTRVATAHPVLREDVVQLPGVCLHLNPEALPCPGLQRPEVHAQGLDILPKDHHVQTSHDSLLPQKTKRWRGLSESCPRTWSGRPSGRGWQAAMQTPLAPPVGGLSPPPGR